MENEVIQVRCERVKDMARPAVPSKLRSCTGCGIEVWISIRLAEELNRDYADHPVGLYCVDCLDRLDIKRVRVNLPPGQLEQLRRAGIPEDEIVGLVALVNVAKGNSTAAQLAALRRKIETNPRSRLARKYRKELPRARKDLGVVRFTNSG